MAEAGDRVNHFGVHEKAHALTGIRILKNGSMRQYSAATFPADPWRGCEHTIRTGMTLGFLRPSSSAPSAGVLDVLDEEGDIVQDFDITTPNAIKWIKRRLGWVVES
jgi:hypothetical protein